MEQSWACGLCGSENVDIAARYDNVASETGDLLELRAPVVDYTFEGGAPRAPQQRAYLFVVDTICMQPNFLDLVKQCLVAALEGLPSDALVGVMLVGDSLSVFDLGAGSVVSVKHLVDPNIGIEQVLPIGRFLVRKSDPDGEDALVQCIDNLHRFVSGPSAVRDIAGAVASVIAYAECYRDLRPLRVGMFLSGRPHDLSSHRVMDIDPETSVYRDFADRSVACSVVWDIFAHPQEDGGTLGLASLKWLCSLTGGQLRLSVVPQDCFRLYKSVFATQCLLAIRCSPDLAVATRYFGNTSEPTAGPLVTRLCCVSDRDTFSFDVEFTTSSGIYTEHAVVQAAFSYDDGRVLRVITARAKTSLSWRLIYPSVSPETHLTLLMHKIVRVCFDDSVASARDVLKKWLQNLEQLCTNNNTTLGAFPSIKDIPRFVHALLVSPLLRSVVSGDEWVVVQCMLSRLPPRDVQTYLYPQLSSWSTPDKLQSKGIHLNLASATSTNCAWLVLDAYSVFIVRGSGALPPKETQLRASIDKVRAQRFFNCDVVFDETGEVFQRFLVDDDQKE